MYTDITILVDGSSSMSDVRAKTVSSLKEFIAEQKQTVGRCNLSIYSFNTSKRKLADGDIQKVEFNESLYQPGGMTALYDATCETIDELGVKLNNMPEVARPNKVLFIVLTDGQENSSRRKLYEVRERIQRQENTYSWNFVYLGANFDASEYVISAGLDLTSRLVNYDKSQTQETWRGLSKAINTYRCSSDSKLGMGFSAEVAANAK